MLGLSRERKNIPVSVSLLHEQEYNNVFLRKKRASSEKKINNRQMIVRNNSTRRVNVNMTQIEVESS